MASAGLTAAALPNRMRGHSAVAFRALVVVLPIAVAALAGVMPVRAQEAKDVLTAGETDSDASHAPMAARTGAGGPRHDIVKGTGPDAIVAPIRPTAPVVAAKTLFGAQTRRRRWLRGPLDFIHAAVWRARLQLPVNGPHWQAMRLSRNRNWGHPELVS